MTSRIPLVAVAVLLLRTSDAAAGVCTDGAQQSCTVNGCAGTRTCDGGYWSPCECNEEPPAPTRGVEVRSVELGGDRNIVATDLIGPTRTWLGVPRVFALAGSAHDDTYGVARLAVEKIDRIYCSNRSRDLPEPSIATEVLPVAFPAQIVSAYAPGYAVPTISIAPSGVAFPLPRWCPATHPILLKEETEVWARATLGNGSELLSRKATITYYKTVTVLSFNTEQPKRHEYATAANQAVSLSRLHPDVVLLQEAEPAHASALGTALGLPYVYQNPEDGNSIISRFPVTNGVRVVLPSLGPPLSRCSSISSLTGATVKVGGPCSGTGCPTWDLRVYNTHLDTRNDLPGIQWDFPTYPLPCDSWAQQEAQAEAVVQHIGCWAGAFVLGGDMNARPYDSTISSFLSCWTNAFHALPNRLGEPGPNEHWGDSWANDIDNMYLQGYQVLKTSWFEVCPNCPSASDHAPVATTLKRTGWY